MVALLISVKLVEILWVLFNYFGWEHYTISNGNLHLDFLLKSRFGNIIVASTPKGVCYMAFNDG